MFNAAIRETPSSNEGCKNNFSSYFPFKFLFLHIWRFDSSWSLVSRHDRSGLHQLHRLRHHPRSTQRDTEQEELEARTLHVSHSCCCHNFPRTRVRYCFVNPCFGKHILVVIQISARKRTPTNSWNYSIMKHWTWQNNILDHKNIIIAKIAKLSYLQASQVPGGLICPGLSQSILVYPSMSCWSGFLLLF